jgi:hypothetical protein
MPHASDLTFPSKKSVEVADDYDTWLKFCQGFRELKSIKDYYADNLILLGSRITVLWNNIPLDRDEFDLERGEMYRIERLCSDGRAYGSKLEMQPENWAYR